MKVIVLTRTIRRLTTKLLLQKHKINMQDRAHRSLDNNLFLQSISCCFTVKSNDFYWAICESHIVRLYIYYQQFKPRWWGASSPYVHIFARPSRRRGRFLLVISLNILFDDKRLGNFSRVHSIVLGRRQNTTTYKLMRAQCVEIFRFKIHK